MKAHQDELEHHRQQLHHQRAAIVDGHGPASRPAHEAWRAAQRSWNQVIRKRPRFGAERAVRNARTRLDTTQQAWEHARDTELASIHAAHTAADRDIREVAAQLQPLHLNAPSITGTPNEEPPTFPPSTHSPKRSRAPRSGSTGPASTPSADGTNAPPPPRQLACTAAVTNGTHPRLAAALHLPRTHSADREHGHRGERSGPSWAVMPWFSTRGDECAMKKEVPSKPLRGSSSASTETEILLVSDMPLLTDGILDAITALPHLKIAATVGDEEQAVALTREHTVDVVVAPVQLEPLGGYHLASELSHRRPVPGVVLVDAGGAAGGNPLQLPGLSVLSRCADRFDLASAIAAARWSYPHGRASSRNTQRSGPTECTMRELEVLELVIFGSTNKEIAEKLSIATQTVKAHVSALLAKFSASSRAQLAVVACSPTTG